MGSLRLRSMIFCQSSARSVTNFPVKEGRSASPKVGRRLLAVRLTLGRSVLKTLPTGTVTFLFTDIEGSTTLLQRLGDRRYAEVLEEHRRLLRDAFAQAHGEEINTQGDAVLVAFSRARDALAAAVAAQRSLTKHAWPDGASLRVRMGLHTGEPVSKAGDFVGLDLHRAARICAAGHGGQILLSDAVSALAARDL